MNYRFAFVSIKHHLTAALSLFLFATAQAWQPATNSMLTFWGEKVSPRNAWQEYPRPDFVRASWQNLNGLITCDRKVQKLLPQELAKIHQSAGLTP